MTSSSAVDKSPQPPPNLADAVPAYDRPPTDQDVPCPLCEYNLRGATEPRCPECGYRFEWRDLLDPERRRHPYLFEHHPNRNLWSFIRTFRGTLWPRTFWRTLHPGQPSNVRRLVIYWFIVNLLALALPLSMLALDMTRYALANQQNRGIYVSGRFPGVTPAWLNQSYPLPPSPQFFSQYFSTMRGSLAAAVVIAPLYTAWPWLTFLALNVFQISMLRARVNASHVLRCVIYTFDAIAVVCWSILVVAGATVAAVVLLQQDVYWSRSEEHTSELQSQSNLVCRLLLRLPPRSTLFPYTTLFRSWLTFLALNVFQISMLRARVNASHVLRCVIYTFDAIAVVCWSILVVAGATVAAVVLLQQDVYWS